MYFTFFTILIAVLGLFGLSSFNTEQRIPEIGIRKVLGSSVKDILLLLTGGFSKLILIAIIIAIPLAWYGIDSWLQGFAFRTEVPWWIFPLSGLLALIVALLTTASHALRASLLNPVDSLKYE